MSDISQVFEVDDIFTLMDGITAMSSGESEKKTGILSSVPISDYVSKLLLLK